MTASSQLRIYQKKIKNAVFQAQKKAAKEIVQILIDLIRTRTRLLGEFVSGSLISSKGLSDKYIKLRQKYSKRLDADTSPSTSNATATGQMINSMKGKAVGTKVIIELKDKRTKELNKSKPKLTNSEVNKYYEDKKGKWFGLQEIEKEEGIAYAAEIIKEEIQKVSK